MHQQGLVIGYLVGIGGHLRQGEQDAVVEVIEMGVTLDVRGVGNIVEYSQSIIKATQTLQGIGLVKAGRR